MQAFQKCLDVDTAPRCMALIEPWSPWALARFLCILFVPPAPTVNQGRSTRTLNLHTGGRRTDPLETFYFLALLVIQLG